MQDDRVVIMGIGRIGLPLGLMLAASGYRVLGLDVNQAHLAALKAGKVPFVEDGLESYLKAHLGKRFFPSDDFCGIAQCRYIVLTLGTPVDDHLNPSYQQLDSAIESITPYLRKGHVIILRSTVAPGTSERLAGRLEAELGLRVGKDIFVSFCPERIAEGAAFKEIPAIPQIVGGVDPRSTAMAEAFFRPLTKIVLTTDARSAELAKLFTNMYRYINFAIANEFMMLADGFDRNIYDIVDLVNKDYPRGGLSRPGFAAGPCLYKDGFFLLDRLSFPDLISTSWRINETIPNYLVSQLGRHLDLTGKTVAILGMTFKKNIDDKRNSLSYKLKRILSGQGVRVVTHDPYLAPGPLPAVLKTADVVVLAVNHDAYAELGMEALSKLLKPGAWVCDLWNVLRRNEIIFQPKRSRKGKAVAARPKTSRLPRARRELESRARL